MSKACRTGRPVEQHRKLAGQVQGHEREIACGRRGEHHADVRAFEVAQTAGESPRSDEQPLAGQHPEDIVRHDDVLRMA